MVALARQLRAEAIARALFPPTTLPAALARMGFVQADPIRAPAPAQDLILRHRVRGYRVGDLERAYPRLEVEEDYLYAYGFMRRDVWRAIHPRKVKPLSALDRRVLALVHELGEAHPSDVAARLGHGRVVNAWGGHSKATTHALDALQYAGLLRVARRDHGIRVYALALADAANATPPRQQTTPKTRAARLRTLVLLMATILAPAPERTVRANIARLRRLGDPRAALDSLVHEGKLARTTFDGIAYVSPPPARTATATATATATTGIVRLLAPFDPLVWDRARFEHLFGWTYRFEAYTPPAKRVRGYYAMPLLWRDSVIGWANVSRPKASARDGAARRDAAARGLDVEVGFVGTRPRDAAFRVALDAEIEALRTFLEPRSK